MATVFSVLGGVFGYLIGLFLFDTLAMPVLEQLGKAEKVTEFSGRVEDYGAIAVFGAGLTPFPYKVITIMSGALMINFAAFMAASVIGRGMRFFLVAWIVRKFGGQAEKIMKERFALFTIVVFAAAALGYWVLHTYL